MRNPTLMLMCNEDTLDSLGLRQEFSIITDTMAINKARMLVRDDHATISATNGQMMQLAHEDDRPAPFR